MPNVLLTPQVIAREALATLYAQTVMLPLVYKDWANEFVEKGDTITIRKPATFQVNDFDPVNGIVIQDIVEGSTDITMDQHHDVSVRVTSKQLTLELADLRNQVLAPMMEAHAQAIDTKLLAMASSVYQTVGEAGEAMTDDGPIRAARRILNVNNVPMTNRYLLLDPYSEEQLLGLDRWIDASKNQRSNGTALDEAVLGRKYGFDVITATHPYEYDAGNVSVTGTLATNGSTAAGATTINVDATTLTGTIPAGTALTVDGQQFVTTAAVTAAGNAAALPVSPAVGATITDGTTVTMTGDHSVSLAFHRDAFAFVSRPLAVPNGAPNAEIVNYKGLGLRVIYDYDMKLKQDIISIDMLFGLKTIRPEAAVRILTGENVTP